MDTSSITAQDIVATIVYFTKELIKKKNNYNQLKTEYDKYNCEIESNNRWMEDTNRYYEDQKFDKRVPCWPTFFPASAFIISNQNDSYKNKLKEIEPKFKLAKLNYEKEISNVDSFFNKLDINKIIEVANYLDIETDEIDKEKIVNKIKESIINDFEILLSHEQEFPDDLKYIGTISIIKNLIYKTIDCLLIIKNCKYYNSRMQKLWETKKDIEQQLVKKEEEYENLKNSLLNKVFKRAELQKLSEEVKRLNKLNSDLIYEIYVIKDTVETLPNKKNILCNKLLISIIGVNQLIDKLGEKSLRELIAKLNIGIASTDDNYFNEKEEMKSALKNWFDIKRNKLEDEINNDNESVSTSKQKVIRDGAFDRGTIFGI